MHVGYGPLDHGAHLLHAVARTQVPGHDEFVVKPIATRQDVVEMHVAEHVNLLFAVARSDEDSSGSGSSGDSSVGGDEDSSGRDHPEDDGTVDDDLDEDRSGSDDDSSSGRDHPEDD